MRANPWTSYGRGHYCVLDLFSYLRFHLLITKVSHLWQVSQGVRFHLSHYKGAMQHRDIKFVYVFVKPDAEAIDSVRAFPFLAKPSVLGGLKSELPNYLAKAMDMDPNTNALQWWRAHKGDLPTGLLLLLKFH